VALPFAVAFGVGFSGEVIWFSLRRRRVSGGLLGRVSSVDSLVSYALLPLSFALDGRRRAPIDRAVQPARALS
jgi:hypothetical protein